MSLQNSMKMTKKTKTIILWVIGIWIGLAIVYAVYSAITEETESTPVATEENSEVKTINIEDDAVLMRFKNIYSKLLSFKDNPDFHVKGFGEGGDYHGWYMAAHNFTEKDESHLMNTYGIVPGDLLMLGQEYIKSKGKETEYSLGKRNEFERIFSAKTWHIE